MAGCERAAAPGLIGLLAALSCFGDATLSFETVGDGDDAGLDLGVDSGGPAPEDAAVPPLDAGPEEPVAFREVDGLIVFEAENSSEDAPGVGLSSNQRWVEMPEPPEGFTGRTAVQALPNEGFSQTGTTAGPVLTYRIRPDSPGEFLIWLRLWSLTEFDNSVYVGIDGEPLSLERWGVRLEPSFRREWAWVDRVSDNQGSEPLRVQLEGLTTQEVQIWMREDGSVVDKVVLSRDPDFVPEGQGPAETPRN